jgi:LmbE family N-acetylglucosaminyl deacetylase
MAIPAASRDGDRKLSLGIHMKRRFKNSQVIVSLLLVIAVVSTSILTRPGSAQVRPIYDYGAGGLGQLLLRLQTTGSIMYTGAHPDDEDSALLSYLARGLHVRTAYLSLTRGDGGQNLLGSEQSEALGVIRTEELLQARRLDGAEQYFTRAFDYGFSKTLDEAKAKWPEQEVLGDMVRAIRIFRPMVVVSGFSGTPADGHGQHQYAGYLTPKAIAAASDPTQFPEHLRIGLRPWKVRKVYMRANPRSTDNPPTLRLNSGTFDPLIGRSYFEIAVEGRSLHRTQDQGGIEAAGPRFSGVRLINGVETWKGPDTDLFTGLDTSIDAIGEGISDPAFADALSKLEAAAAKALADFDAITPRKTIPALADGFRAVQTARAQLQAMPASEARDYADGRLAYKEAQFTEALQRAAGIEFDVLADRETLTQGDSCSVSLQAYWPADPAVKSQSIGLVSPAGWTSVRVPPNPAATPNPVPPTMGSTQHDVKLTIGPAVARTEPYWLTEPRDDGLFRWPDRKLMWTPDDPLSLPFTPDPVYGLAQFEIGGAEVKLKQPLRYRYADDVRGEIRREVNVVPALSLQLEPDLLVVPLGDIRKPQKVVAVVTNNADHAAESQVRLRVPAGWAASPSAAPVSFKLKGERRTVEFQLLHTGPPSAASEAISGEVSAGGQTVEQAMRVISYPHIQTHRIYEPAAIKINTVDLKVAPVRVGYVMGAGDEVPDAIRRMGLTVTLLDEGDLATGDLNRFDTIVIGIRAADARPDFIANHQRLLDFARNGGTLIVQYQRPNYAALNLLPFPAKIGPRITDENADVKLLHPEDQLFNWPNKISANDWNGWVQERTLYSFTEFSDPYLPMVEMKDPGEAPQNGGEVIAPLGKGWYIYSSFAWFRQLPAGVPGAYRLFANLLSRGKKPNGS